MTVTIKSITDDHVVVEGWGVVFGGRDLDGDAFAPDTEFPLMEFKGHPVYYDHTLSDVDIQIGEVKMIMRKNTEEQSGLWVEAQLARHNEYIDEIIKLVEAGALGWSSGSAGHLIRRKDGVIKRWPIVEMSLTPTPAEPRTLGVQQLKALAKLTPNLEAILPQEPGEGSGAGATVGDNENKTNSARGGFLEASPNIVGEPAPELIIPTQRKSKEMSDKETAPVDVDAIKSMAIQEYQAELEAEAEAERQKEAEVQSRVKALLEDEGALKSAGFNVPAFNKIGGGDDNDGTKAYLHYIRTGQENHAFRGYATKASNDTDMNIGTAADGGNAVPTGHHNEIIARRDEMMIARKVGARNIPGVGTTVNVPIDNEADGEFITSGESSLFDRDAPAIGTVAMTLAKYTKRIQITDELLWDEDSRLMEFLNDFVGRGLAKTHNNLFITAAGSTGATSLKTFANASTIAIGELEDILGNNDLAEYLDDDSSIHWIMRNSTLWDIKSLRSSSARAYHAGSDALGAKELLGYPVQTSQKVAAVASSAKSVYFGNWYYMAYRDMPGLTFLRDPYTRSNYGEVYLNYYFRTIYKPLIAEALGYGAHPSS